MECIKHGEVEGGRNAEGRLVCPICVGEQRTAAQEANDETARRERAQRLVAELFDPERMERTQRERVEQFKESLVDALAEKFKGKQVH